MTVYGTFVLTSHVVPVVLLRSIVIVGDYTILLRLFLITIRDCYVTLPDLTPTFPDCSFTVVLVHLLLLLLFVVVVDGNLLHLLLSFCSVTDDSQIPVVPVLTDTFVDLIYVAFPTTLISIAPLLYYRRHSPNLPVAPTRFTFPTPLPFDSVPLLFTRCSLRCLLPNVRYVIVVDP